MKVLVLLLAILLIAGSGYAYLQSQQLNQAPLSTVLSGDKQSIVQTSQHFMEDLKYKDFKAAAKYSLPEQQATLDMPALIERLFQVKPEFLDIQKYTVTATDQSGERARVHLNAHIKILNTDESRIPEIILYYKKKNGQWYMDFASSVS